MSQYPIAPYGHGTVHVSDCLPPKIEVVQMPLDSQVYLVIKHFIKQREMFTSLDISNAVKEVRKGVRHREIAPLIRGQFEDCNSIFPYTRKVIDVTTVGGEPTQTFLYHHPCDDPDLYTKRNQRPRSPW